MAAQTTMRATTVRRTSLALSRARLSNPRFSLSYFCAPRSGFARAHSDSRSKRRGVEMLAADKLLLRSSIKQRTIELREKELNLFMEDLKH